MRMSGLGIGVAVPSIMQVQNLVWRVVPVYVLTLW